MKRLLERLFGPLGGFRDVGPPPASPEGMESRYGYVPTDQRRAMKGFLALFGVIVAVNLVILVVVLIARAGS